MDERFSVPPTGTDQNEIYRSKEPKKRFWGSITRRITRRKAAAVVAGASLIGGGGVVAKNEIQNNPPITPEKSVKIWDGAAFFGAGTILEKQDGQTAFVVPEGKVLELQGFEIKFIYPSDTRYAMAHFENQDLKVNLNKAGNDGLILNTYVYKRNENNRPDFYHTTLKVDSEGRVVDSNGAITEINQASLVDDNPEVIKNVAEKNGLQQTPRTPSPF
jgi:hypothetical protein